MGETRVDLQHLLEDLRDAYTGSLEETILTEIAANALDSGASFEPWTQEGFEGMARRVWLSVRCHARPDLKHLMRSTITSSSIPEFTGFDAFYRRALDAS